MSDEERTRILRMVAEGKISPEQAADLLEAIQSEPATETMETDWEPEPPPPPSQLSPYVQFHSGRRKGRHLVIQIKDGGESKVNLRIPFGLTRTASKFLPRQAQAYLGKYDINLQELLEEVGQSGDGTILEIRDGENKVLIAVE